MIRFLRWWWIGSTLAFFLFTDSLKIYTVPFNRFFMQWGWEDLTHIILALAATGLTIALLRAGLELASRRDAFKVPLINLSFCLFLFALLPYIFPKLPVNEFLLWKFYLRVHPWTVPLGLNHQTWVFTKQLFLSLIFPAMLLYFSFKKPHATRNAFVKIVLFLSPVMVITLAQFSTYKAFNRTAGKLPPESVAVSTAPNIYVIVFASLSPNFLFENGDISSRFPSFKKLAETSVVMHNAESPSIWTLHSAPTLIGRPRLEGDDHDANVLRNSYKKDFLNDNIFKTAKQMRWHSYVVGALLPYSYWLKGDVDYAWTAAKTKYNPTSLGDGIRRALLFGLRPMIFFIGERHTRQLRQYYSRLEDQRISSFYKSVQSQSLRVFRSAQAPALIYVHHMAPSMDSVQNLNHITDPLARNRARVDDSDPVLKELMEEIKKTGQWDRSLVIVTSDHGWRDVTEKGESLVWAKTVPLFIKLPYQIIRADSFEPFVTNQLRDFLITAMGAKGDKRTLLYSSVLSTILTEKQRRTL